MATKEISVKKYVARLSGEERERLVIRIRDALINFDVLMTEGFGLVVDGRMKAVFPTQEEARKSAENLKADTPCFRSRCMTRRRARGCNCQQEKQLSRSTNNIRMNCGAP
jgi:hypothetical protein